MQHHQCLKYKGWPNRETWAAWTAIVNDEFLFVHLKNKSAELIHAYFRDELEYYAGDHTLATNYILESIGSLERVDWTAIADALKGNDHE
jgi:hypothetical protein